jgi:putative CocE/NonD family hydrolase
VSWLDTGTAEGALERFNTLPNPQRVTITSWSHLRHDNDTDPFYPGGRKAEILGDAYLARQADFFDKWLKDRPAPAPEKKIVYYTLGSGDGWRVTREWPPKGLTQRTWYLGDGGGLAEARPGGAGSDVYQVDLRPSTGDWSRWDPFKAWIVYNDQRPQDPHRLTYTSAPMAEDEEITGSPLADLWVASTARDADVHVYLEDVAPDGRVAYVTEGLLRASNAASIAPDKAPYRALGPWLTFRREEQHPLTPGQPVHLQVPVFPTSVLIRKGHKIRIAIAGSDQPEFELAPENRGATWTILRDSAHPSSVALPMRKWDGTAKPFREVAGE